MNIYTARRIFRSIKRTQVLNQQSNRTSHPVVIDEFDIIRKFANQRGMCHWSNLALDEKYNKKPNHPFAISIDRLDGGGDYTDENTVLAYRMFNLGRGRYSAKEFNGIMIKMLEKLNARPVQGSDSIDNAIQKECV